MDAAKCKTVFLSELFLREIYDGQLFIKLKKGLNFPAMDPWGTSDPYVVFQLDGQVLKSKIKWGKKDPTWNEEFSLNIKLPPTKTLQLAAWDANLITPHKRMGNAGINLEYLCDGNLHELLVELEGMGGGGKVQFEVNYKRFDEIDDEKKWWKVPFVSEFFRKSGFSSALEAVVGSETVQARQFVQFAFGQLASINNLYLQRDSLLRGDQHVLEDTEKSSLQDLTSDHGDISSSVVTQDSEDMQSEKLFWKKKFTDVINQNVIQKLGLAIPEKIKWDGIDLLNKIGSESRRIAEAGYIASGLASSRSHNDGDDGNNDTDDYATFQPLSISMIQSSLPDIKKVTGDLLRQTDSILGALMVLNASNSQSGKEENEDSKNLLSILLDGPVLDEKKGKEMKALFSTAESAMEAWAMLATALGQPSFIKSEFEKICFLDNPTTDTQVAIWRDCVHKRLVVAFRGTEQVVKMEGLAN